MQEKLGELTLTAFSFCTFCNFCPEETAGKTFLKFKKRLDGVKQLAAQDRYFNLNSQPVEIMLSYWRKAKKLDNTDFVEQSEQLETKVDIFEKAVLVENQARDFGFKWDHYQRLLAKAHDECQEVAEAIEFSHKPEKLQEELRDLILVIFSFDMYCDFHPKETIQKSLDVTKIRLNTARVTGISDNLF